MYWRYYYGTVLFSLCLTGRASYALTARQDKWLPNTVRMILSRLSVLEHLYLPAGLRHSHGLELRPGHVPSHSVGGGTHPPTHLPHPPGHVCSWACRPCWGGTCGWW